MTQVTRNILRTFVPSAVGAATTYLTKLSTHLTPAEVAVLFPLATTAYYGIVRLLEEKFPKLGWLLGCLPKPKVVGTVNLTGHGTISGTNH